MLRFSKFQRRMRKEKMIHETQAGENHPSHPYCCRDYMMPDAGVYTAIYNYFYTTGQLNDSNGDEINSVTIKPGPGLGIERGINVDVNMYALAPTLIWVTDLKSLGMKYGALISPTFVNANFNAEIEALRGRGGSVSTASFGPGDLYVQPVWLGKSISHFD